MMGSAAWWSWDEDTCMVDVARYFLDFTRRNPAASATFCRIGTKHLLRILSESPRAKAGREIWNCSESLSWDSERFPCGWPKTSPIR